MFKKYENNFFIFIFFFTSILVFFSRYLQIIFVRKNKEQFYLFEDPIFINPDAYYYLGTIKNKILDNTSFFEKLLSDNFLSSLFLILHGVFNNSNILEIIMLSQPYLVVITFLSIFLFFSSLTNRFIALLISFVFILSDLFIARSSVLFFDTDIFNIFYFFSILYIISLYFREDLSRKNFYLYSLIILILFSLFCFHYPKSFFSILFFFILLFSFFLIKQRKVDIFVVLFIYILISLSFYGNGLIENTASINKVYSSGQVIDSNKSISISSSVSELKLLSILEIEKLLFYKSFSGLFLLLSLGGIVLYFKNNLKKFIFFIPFFLFSYLSLTKGMRFLIYTSPYIYFGVFYLLNLISYKFKTIFGYKISKKVIYVFLFVLIWQNSFASCKNYFKGQCSQTSNIKPYFNKNIVKGIIRINNFSDSFNILSAWDYGYLIDFYSNSKFELSPGMAFKKNKFDIFYSNKDINSKKIQSEFNIRNQADNFIFLTNDFIKWWPTIVMLNSNEDEKTPQIIQFSCKENEKRILKCNSKTGISSKVNLKFGTIDEKKILYKLITHSKNGYSEKLFNSEGSVILIYTPSLRHTNLTAIFPKEFEDLFFIKYFFFNYDDENIKLIDDSWPNYRTYKVN
jgi:hypothetical protein